MLKQNYKFLAIQSDESKKKIKVDYYDLQTDNHDELYQQITMPSSRERAPLQQTLCIQIFTHPHAQELCSVDKAKRKASTFPPESRHHS